MLRLKKQKGLEERYKALKKALQAGDSAGTPHLVFGGDKDQVRSVVPVLSWKNLPALVKTLG